MNPLLFAIFHQIILRQQRVRLDLVHCRSLSRRLDNRLEMLNCKVAHTDSFDLARVAKSEHARGGIDYTLALRDAKRAVRRSDAWSEPFYWAAFVLTGIR